MPSLTGFEITATNSNVTTDSAAILTALSTSTALATSTLLGPTVDAKAPKHNPVFTGTVQRVTAGMVTTSDNSTVQSKLSAIDQELDTKADIRT